MDDLTYWFFVFNCLQIKLLLLFTILFVFGFYKIYLLKHKAFIGRSRTSATCKMEIFVKEVTGEKLLIINTEHTVLDVAGGL